MSKRIVFIDVSKNILKSINREVGIKDFFVTE